MADRSRRDTLGRQLSADDRRKRRNLSDFPGASLGQAVVEPDVPPGCPNAAPSDSALERCTQQGTGDPILGDAYELVSLDSAAILPGDVISYCFEGRVFPGDTGNPTQTECDGKFGLVVNGLLGRDNFANGLAQWEVINGAWHTRQKPSGKWELEGEISNTADVDQVVKIRFKNLAPRDQLWMQVFNYREGVPTKDQDDTIDNEDPPGGYYWVVGYDQGLAEVSASEGGLFYALDSDYDDGWAQINGHGNGLSINASEATLEKVDGDVWTEADLAGVVPDLWLSLWHEDAETRGWCRDGLADNLSTNTAHDDVDAWPILVVRRDGARVNGADSLVDVGYQRFQDFAVCAGNEITITGLPTGYWTRMFREWMGGAAFPNVGQPAEEEVSGTTVHVNEHGEVYPVDRIEVWDGEPGGGGTLVHDCVINRGMWGGDTWNYDETGTQTGGGETVTDAAATVRLEILDIDGVLIGSAYEPTGVSTTAYTQASGQAGQTDIAIPYNAVTLRFTPLKTGTGDRAACVRRLQVNKGSECCDFTDPETSVVDSTGDGTLSVVGGDDVVVDPRSGSSEPHLTQLWSVAENQFVTADDLVLARDEHRENTPNLQQGGHAVVRVDPGKVATEGEPYEPICLDSIGLEPGDTVSIQFEARVEA